MKRKNPPEPDPPSKFDLTAELAQQLTPLLEMDRPKSGNLPAADSSSATTEHSIHSDGIDAGEDASRVEELFEAFSNAIAILIKALPKTARVSAGTLLRMLNEAIRKSRSTSPTKDPMQVASELLDRVQSASELLWIAAFRIDCTLAEGSALHADLSSSSTPVVLGRCPEEKDAASWSKRACELLEVPFELEIQQAGHVLLLFVESGDPETATLQAIQRFNDILTAAWIAYYLQHPVHLAEGRPQPEAYHHEPEIVGLDRLIMYRVRGAWISQDYVKEDLLSTFKLPALEKLRTPATSEIYRRLSQWLSELPVEHPSLATEKLFQSRLVRSIRAFGRALNSADESLAFLFSVVALESLVERKVEGLREAFSNMGAILSETAPEARACTSQSLKRAYDLRSKLVHQAILPRSKGDEEFQECRDIVVWAYMQALTKVLPLGGQGLTDDAYFGALGKLKLGLSWEAAWAKPSN